MTFKQIAFATLACCASLHALAAENMLQPFTATYGVEWRGMGAGNSTLELLRVAQDEYTYRSRNVARGVFRIAFPDAITQASQFNIVAGVVVPKRYQADDGSSDTDRDVTLDFDWKSGEVTGTAENKPVKVAVSPGTQDSLSVQVALMLELAAGRSPESFLLLDKNEVKEYRYSREASVNLTTPLGKLDTLIYRSERVGSTRVTRLWLAPSLGYLPVRAEQIRNGKREFSLNITALKRH